MQPKYISNYRLSVVKEPTILQRTKITSSKNAELAMRNFYTDNIEIYESFHVLYLNRANDIVGHAEISRGSATGTVVCLKMIFKYALDSLSNAIILCHNHPSGQLRPSQQDIDLTKKTKEAGKIMEVQLLDHVIVTKDGHYSFADEGML